ncbi:MAG: aminotransferase class I/II-fold pyridoxal phosphate-dependent enzyme, partial [bacterium]
MVERSKRLEKIPPYLFGEIARIKQKALSEGKDIIDLGIGDPDQPTPMPIIEALAKSAHNPDTHRYDESPLGQPEFLQAAARWYKKETGQVLDPESEILLLIGSKEGLAHVAWAYLDPGDLSIVPNPAYTVYKVNSQMAGADVYEMPLVAENGFLPDIDAIPADVANRAKLMFLNYPNNPTGAVATREFYQKAVDFAHKYNVLLINDCAYFTVTYDGFKHPSLLEIPGAREVTLEFHSLSKMFNMTGWRAGFAIGDKDAVA